MHFHLFTIYHAITGFIASHQVDLIEDNLKLRKADYSWGSASTMPMRRLQNQSAQYLGICVSKYLCSSEIAPATIIRCIKKLSEN